MYYTFTFAGNQQTTCADPDRFVSLSEGVQLWQRLFFSSLSWWGEREVPNITKSEPSSARQQKTPFIEMAFRWQTNHGPTQWMAFRWRADHVPTLIMNPGWASLWLFWDSGPVLLWNPLALWFFSGGGGRGNGEWIWMHAWNLTTAILHMFSGLYIPRVCTLLGNLASWIQPKGLSIPYQLDESNSEFNVVVGIFHLTSPWA